MLKIASVILHYNTPEFTLPLLNDLRQQTYRGQTIYVVDHGSRPALKEATHRLDTNLKFTKGMHAAWKIARADADYDAYWLLNNDLQVPKETLATLVDILFSKEEYGLIAPAHNSPHGFMNRPESEAHVVPYLEAPATLIKRTQLAHVGFWDLRPKLGWGIEVDYGFRVRQAGLLNILTNRARIVHLEHGTIGGVQFGKYCHVAGGEMHEVLGQKYGANWEQVLQMSVGP